MKAKILIWLLAAFLLIYIVSAEVEPLPKGPCEWTRESTEYRSERNFTGVYGRFSDGSIRCFSPGTTSTIKTETTTGHATTCKEVCKEKTIKKCKWINHRCGHKKICYEKTIQKCRRICK